MNHPDNSRNSRSEPRNSEEIPLPEDHFRRLGIASRPTFFRWEKQGLRVLRVGGRRFIYPSDLRSFMEMRNANQTGK